MLVFDPNSRWPPGRDSWQDADSGKLQDFCSGNQPGDGGRGWGAGGRQIALMSFLDLFTHQTNKCSNAKKLSGRWNSKIRGVGVGGVCNTPCSRILCLSTAAVGSLLSPFIHSIHCLSVCPLPVIWAQHIGPVSAHNGPSNSSLPQYMYMPRWN